MPQDNEPSRTRCSLEETAFWNLEAIRRSLAELARAPVSKEHPGEELVVRSRDGPERSFPLAQHTRIGRNADNDIRLHSGMVSRLHAVIEKRDDGYWIRDNASLNGTFVNGLRIGGEFSKLQTGDSIRIAETEFVVHADGGGASPLDPDRRVMLDLSQEPQVSSEECPEWRVVAGTPLKRR